MLIFAIESSHDDTSFALLEDNKPIWMETISQIDIHRKYGGTVPELASRLHVKNIGILINKLKKIIDIKKIDYVAYTKEPGLVGSLHVGYVVANAMAMLLEKPILPLNHLEGHFFSAFIGKEVEYPALGLIVSGGHSQLMLYKSKNEYEVIGQTQDDAVGEVFDKIARKLNLGFPGGPIIDKKWMEFRDKYTGHFTIPHTEAQLNFSFSGLKTQVINLINNQINRKQEINVDQYATMFENTVVLYLKNHLEIAIKKYHPRVIVLAGGVSANKAIREMFLNVHSNAIIPEMKYTTDNAMMIARLAYELLRRDR